MRSLHLKSEEQLLGWLVDTLQSYMAQRSCHLIVSDDIATSSLSADVAVDVRYSREAAIAAAFSGHKVLFSPADQCAFNAYQANPQYQPLACGKPLTLAQVYRYDPAPLGINRFALANISGGCCMLSTEFITTPAMMEYMLLPRIMATAECLWTPADRKDWNRFRKDVEEQKDRLSVRKYNYCEGSFTPQFVARRVDNHTTNVAISTEVPNTYIFYTTDLSTPTRSSSIYIGPINLQRGTHIKILTVYKDIERDSIYEFLIK